MFYGECSFFSANYLNFSALAEAAHDDFPAPIAAPVERPRGPSARHRVDSWTRDPAVPSNHRITLHSQHCALRLCCTSYRTLMS